MSWSVGMHITRRTVLSLTATQLALLNAGCATGPAPVTRHYTEKVSMLLISQDHKQLVILGDNHHYVFDCPPDVAMLPKSPLRAKVSAAFSPFKVDIEGVITGMYMLHLPDNLTPVEVDQAHELGFTQDEQGHWFLGNKLTGKRYVQGNTLRAWRDHEKLNRTYEVSVEAVETPIQHAAEEMSTPVYLTSHGVLLIYLAPLAPLLIPMMFMSYEKRPQLPSAASAASTPASAVAP